MGNLPSDTSTEDLTVPKNFKEEKEFRGIQSHLTPNEDIVGVFNDVVDDPISSGIEKLGSKNYGVLPMNVIHNILVFQSPSDVFNMMLTCRVFLVCANNQHFWKCYFENRVKNSEQKRCINQDNKNLGGEEKKNWKNLFFNRFCHGSNEYYRKKYRLLEKNRKIESNCEQLPTLRIVLTGVSRSGKSSFLERVTSNSFNEKFTPTPSRPRFQTLCFEYDSKDGTKKNIRVEFCDSSGKEKNEETNKLFYRHADCAMIFFGIDSVDGFEKARYLVGDIRFLSENTYNCANFVLVGTKKDLGEFISKRKVKFEGMVDVFIIRDHFGHNCGYEELKYVEISSKLDVNVYRALGLALDKAIKRRTI